jgi:hypothetical protein
LAATGCGIDLDVRDDHGCALFDEALRRGLARDALRAELLSLSTLPRQDRHCFGVPRSAYTHPMQGPSMANEQPAETDDGSAAGAGLDAVTRQPFADAADGDAEDEDLYGPASFPASDPPSSWWGGSRPA